MKVMDELLAPADTLLNPDIEEWKKAGGKTIGYFCTAYVPEELISAAGMLPFRMRATGSTGTEKGDKYAHSTTCSFVRHTFDMALRENYSFLDGLVAPTVVTISGVCLMPGVGERCPHLHPLIISISLLSRLSMEMVPLIILDGR